jgi:arylsulfatase A-like enzyme
MRDTLRGVEGNAMARTRSSFPRCAVVAGAALLAAALILGPLPPADRASGAAPLVQPNIVFILTDDQTMESVAKMPYVSSRTDWISFEQASVNNALCCPSRATILTGQYDTHTGVGNNAQGTALDERETLAVWLQRAGYQTGLFGKYLNAYPFGRGLYVPPGWNDWEAAYSAGPQWQLYPQYHWKLNSNGRSVTYLRKPADYEVNVLANRMISFIKTRASAHQRFFAEFTPSSTHYPWKASPTRAGTMKNAAVPLNPNFDVVADNQPAYLKAQPLLTASSMQADRRKEWEGAASVDDAVKKIDATLRTAGVFNNTIEIFMTDNGYAFGDHRWETKRCEFTECSQVPLLVRYPGLTARHDATHLVSNVDIASTISELAGATPVIAQDGSSLVPLILGADVPWRDSLLLHWPGGDMEGKDGQPDSMPQFWGVLARTANGGLWKYVEVDTGERELYDEVADPDELANVVGNPSDATVLADLQARLATLKAAAGASQSPAAIRADVPVPGPVGPDYD